MSWEEHKLDDLLDKVIDYRGKTPPKSLDGIRLITAKVIKEGRILDEAQQEYILPEIYDDVMRRGIPSRGDILITTEAPLGEVAILDSDEKIALAQRVILLRPNTQMVEPRFLYYQLQTSLFQGRLYAKATGTTVLGIKNPELRSLCVPIAPIEDQKKIVAVLSAYESLIGSNRRRIQLLEEAARLMYREWFVKLRFPGHEIVSVTDGVPKGWTTCILSEVADVNSSSLTAKDRPESIRYVDISSVGTGKIDVVDEISFEEAPGRARRKVQHGDIIWSCVRPNRRSYALIWEPQDNLIVSTGFAVLTSRTIPFSYLYFASTTDDFVSYLTNQATGAAYPAVAGKDFEKASILLPDTETLAFFDKIVLPLLEQIDCCNRQNMNLQEARDMLLPKLMSGAMDVSRIAVSKEVEV